MNEPKPPNEHPVFHWLAGLLCGGAVIAAFYFAYADETPGHKTSAMLFLLIAAVLYSALMRKSSLRNLKLNAGGIFGGVAGAVIGFWLLLALSHTLTTFTIIPIIVGALVGNFLWGLVTGKRQADEEPPGEKALSERDESGLGADEGRPGENARPMRGESGLGRDTLILIGLIVLFFWRSDISELKSSMAGLKQASEIQKKEIQELRKEIEEQRKGAEK
jgi:hypothetical protein